MAWDALKSLLFTSSLQFPSWIYQESFQIQFKLLAPCCLCSISRQLSEVELVPSFHMNQTVSFKESWRELLFSREFQFKAEAEVISLLGTCEFLHVHFKPLLLCKVRTTKVNFSSSGGIKLQLQIWKRRFLTIQFLGILWIQSKESVVLVPGEL